IVQGWLEVPDTLELPGVLRAIVPLMRRQRLAGLRRNVVDKFVALTLGPSLGRGGRLAGRSARLMPGFAPVAGSLDDLPKPAAGLGRIDAIGIDRRALHVVDFPAGKQGTLNVPPLALALRC